MKNRFIRIISILCAAILMAGAVSAWAAEDEPATPSDLAPEVKEEMPEEPETEQPAEPEEEPAEEQTGEPETETPEEPEAEVPESVPEEQTEETPAENPVEQPEQKPDKKPEEKQEGPAQSEEIIITKKLRVGQSWSGKMSKKKPAILKLDVSGNQSVHVLVEGKDVWITVEKTDQVTENPPRTETDPETKRTVISWNAQAGSYLITLGPVEPNLMAKAEVTIMNDEAFEAWEAKQVEEEPEANEEPEPEEEPQQEEMPEPEEEIKSEEKTEIAEEPEQTEPEEESETVEESETEEETELEEETESEPAEEDESEPAEEQSEENRPESELEPEREIDVDISWDVPDPVIGDTAHFKAILTGYEGLNYTIQWQYGPDQKTWYDIPGATNLTMDVVVTEEKNDVYWRILVFVEDEQGI